MRKPDIKPLEQHAPVLFKDDLRGLYDYLFYLEHEVEQMNAKIEELERELAQIRRQANRAIQHSLEADFLVTTLRDIGSRANRAIHP